MQTIQFQFAYADPNEIVFLISIIICLFNTLATIMTIYVSELRDKNRPTSFITSFTVDLESTSPGLLNEPTNLNYNRRPRPLLHLHHRY